MLNAGFLLSELESIDSSASGNCDYIALHDVDLIPNNDQLPYTYPAKGLLHVSAPGIFTSISFNASTINITIGFTSLSKHFYSIRKHILVNV